MNTSVLAFLQQRQSSSKLVEPGPNAEELKQIITAAVRAPDHARLKPWRFLIIAGEQRQRLGECFAKVAVAQGETDVVKLDKLRLNPLRAPLIMVVIGKAIEHPKIPFSEQQLSAACAAYGVVLAADALGYGAIWRTGDMAYAKEIELALGLLSIENIIGFIYIGTKTAEPKTLEAICHEDFLSYWVE